MTERDRISRFPSRRPFTFKSTKTDRWNTWSTSATESTTRGQASFLRDHGDETLQPIDQGVRGRLGRREPLAIGAEPLDAVAVDRLEQGQAGREMAVQGPGTDTRDAGDVVERGVWSVD